MTSKVTYGIETLINWRNSKQTNFHSSLYEGFFIFLPLNKNFYVVSSNLKENVITILGNFNSNFLVMQVQHMQNG